MNIFVRAWRKATYRDGPEWSRSPQSCGFEVTTSRWGGRTVRDPRLPGYLDARRIRAVREGLDPLDRALLDGETVALLAETVARCTNRDDPIWSLPARTGS